MSLIASIRSKLRGRSTHVWVAASAWLSRIFSAAAQFVLVRILLKSIGVDEYAVFAVLSSLVAWFALFDFGLGVSCQNRISEARARGDEHEGMLLAARLMAIVLIMLSIPLSYLLSPLASQLLLGAFESLDPERRTHLFFIAAACFSTAGISSVVYKIWYAEQRGYLANIIPALSALLGLLGVYWASSAPSEQRLAYALAAFAFPTAILPLGFLVLQLVRTPPRALGSVRRSQVISLIRHGLSYWVFAALGTATLQIDYIVLSRFLGANDIAVYTILTKVFGLAFFIYNAMLMALWPVLTELITFKNWTAVADYLRRYIGMGAVGMVLFTGALWLGIAAVMDVLAPGKGLHVPPLLILAFGCYFLTRVWSDAYGTVLQAMSKMRPFWILVPVQAAISVGLQWILAPRIGLYGILVGLLASFFLTVAWALPFAYRRYVAAQHVDIN